MIDTSRLATKRITPYLGERGSIFLLSMVILTVLLVLGSSLIERSQNAVYRAAVEGRSAKAFHAAEAGIHKALYSLDQPGGWVSYSGDTNVAIPGGGAAVTISPPLVDRAATQRVTLVSTGWVEGPGGSHRYPHTVRVMAHWDPDYFDFAVFGDVQVDVQNGKVDVSPNGHVSELGTNNKNNGAVTISPQGTVIGNVVVGFGATSPGSAVDSKGTISGTIDSLDMPKFMPSVKSIPAGATELGAVSLSGTQLLTLGEGVYHMTSLSMSGQSAISCTGKVRIYLGTPGSAVSAYASISGNGFVNTTGDANNLLVYGFDNLAGITISGNGTLHGGIYAPKALITLNSGNVYGSLIARKVTINGSTSKVYYDETLSDENKSKAIIASWEVL